MHEDVASEDTGLMIVGGVLVAFAAVGAYYVGAASWRGIRKLTTKKK